MFGGHCFRCAVRKSLHRLISSSPIRYQSHHVAVVGSGPAGFYSAQHLLKKDKNIHVDIYEKLPVPFGLVRFGVAPDHPEVKNVINTFTQTARNDRCTFLGNVDVGKDVTLDQLQQAYTAVILSYGASEDKKLGIPGEDLKGVLSGREFVGWYNGLPENRDLNPVLSSTDTAVIIGIGNVALDLARILLSPIDILAKTDISEHALASLEKSTVKHVYIVGRRGPMQVAFTIKELREMIKLPGCQYKLNKEDFTGIDSIVNEIKRPRKRLTELLLKTAMGSPSAQEAARLAVADRDWCLKLCRSPLKFLADSDNKQLTGVRFGINKMEGPLTGKQRVISTGNTEEIPTGLVLRSIGYKSLPLVDDLPFDQNKGVILHDGKGRVQDKNGLYCSGWVKRGPVGVILDTMTDGFSTGKTVLSDITEGKLNTTDTKTGKDKILQILEKNGVKPVFFKDWENLDKVETEKGLSRGKPREKITDTETMLKLVGL